MNAKLQNFFWDDPNIYAFKDLCTVRKLMPTEKHVCLFLFFLILPVISVKFIADTTSETINSRQT